jgi:hypothetical protein
MAADGSVWRAKADDARVFIGEASPWCCRDAGDADVARPPRPARIRRGAADGPTVCGEPQAGTARRATRGPRGLRGVSGCGAWGRARLGRRAAWGVAWRRHRGWRSTADDARRTGARDVVARQRSGRNVLLSTCLKANNSIFWIELY